MRILLDENMPEGLLTPLRLLGHAVDSIASLHLKGLENSPLYREVARRYDLFFTKDREFAAQVRSMDPPTSVKVILTTLPQMAETDFVTAFVEAFTATDWSLMGSVGEWPSREA